MFCVLDKQILQMLDSVPHAGIKKDLLQLILIS